MFFSQQQKSLKAPTRASLTRETNDEMTRALDAYFQEHDQDLRAQLNEAGVVGEEQEEFLRNIRQKMQVNLIKEFREALRESALNRKSGTAELK